MVMTPERRAEIQRRLEPLASAMTVAIDNLWRDRHGTHVQLTESTARTIRHALQEAAAALAQVERQLATVTEQLTFWQTCLNCGEKMDAPGHCSNAQSESERGWELMWNEAVARAERAEADLAQAKDVIRELLEGADEYWQTFPESKEVIAKAAALTGTERREEEK